MGDSGRIIASLYQSIANSRTCKFCCQIKYVHISSQTFSQDFICNASPCQSIHMLATMTTCLIRRLLSVLLKWSGVCYSMLWNGERYWFQEINICNNWCKEKMKQTSGFIWSHTKCELWHKWLNTHWESRACETEETDLQNGSSSYLYYIPLWGILTLFKDLFIFSIYVN